MSQSAPRPQRPGSVLHLLVLGGLAIAQPLLDLTARHAQMFVARAVQPLDIVLLVAVLVLGPGVILGAVVRLGHWIRPAFGRWLHAAAMALLVSLAVMPLLQRLPAHGGVVVALALSAGIAWVWAYRRTAALSTFLTFLAPALVVIPFLFFAPAEVRDVLSPPQPWAGPVPAIAPDAPPVVVLVLDELPLTALLDEQREIDPIRYPRLAELATTATWFRNATTVYARTQIALPALVTGRYPAAHDQRVANAAAHPENLFTWLGAAVDVGAVEAVTRLCPDRINRRLVEEARPWRQRNVALWRDLSWIYLHVVTPQAWAHRLPRISDGWKDFGVQADIADQSRPRMFRTYLDALAVRRNFGLHFLHLLLPHNPYEYYPSGRRYDDRWTIPGWEHPVEGTDYWTDDAVLMVNNYQRLLLQTGFADRLVGALIDRLRELDLFERALIVVVADHGLSFRPGSAKRGAPGEDPRGEIMPVPLLVKAPAQRQGRIDDGNVELIDVLPTIADALGVAVPWPVDGQTLLDPNMPRRPTKRCGVRFDDGGGNIEVFTDTSTKALDPVLEWKLGIFGSGQSRPNGLFRFGRHGALWGQRVDRLTVREASDLNVEWTRPARFAAVDPDADIVPGHIHGWLGKVAPPREWAVAVNGVVQATTIAYQASDGRWALSAIVPENAFVRGANTVEALWIETASDGTLVLHRADTRAAGERARAAFERASDSASSRVYRLGDSASEPLVAGHSTVLEPRDDGTVRVHASSVDPQITIPLTSCCAGRRIVVAMVDIESPADTEIALFFQTVDAPRFGLGNRRQQTLPAGRHQLYFAVDREDLVGMLRLDPGRHPGVYTIHALEIRAADP